LPLDVAGGAGDFLQRVLAHVARGQRAGLFAGEVEALAARVLAADPGLQLVPVPPPGGEARADGKAAFAAAFVDMVERQLAS
jgi:hypothetical protein